MIAVAFVNIMSLVIFVGMFVRIWTRANSNGGASNATSKEVNATSKEVKVLGGAFLISFFTALAMAFWILSA